MAVRPDGSDLHVLAAPTEQFVFFKPVWSPDGSMLLTGCHDLAAGIDRLCTLDADGTDPQVVVEADDPVNFPAWGMHQPAG